MAEQGFDLSGLHPGPEPQQLLFLEVFLELPVK